MSAAELSSAATRHPWDWYVEQPWVTEQLINTLPVNYFDGTTIYDPCCGRGTIPRVFSNPHRYDVTGSDLIKRWPDHQAFFRYDFRSKSAGEISADLIADTGFADAASAKKRAKDEATKVAFLTAAFMTGSGSGR